MADDYAHVAGGSLKLKNGLKINKKDKKIKKNKHKLQEHTEEKEKIEEAVNLAAQEQQQSSSSGGSAVTGSAESPLSWMTETQRKFLKQQEKQKQKRILKKAEESHKDRVQKFNEKLENLSEFYDIPKISWTK